MEALAAPFQPNPGVHQLLTGPTALAARRKRLGAVLRRWRLGTGVLPTTAAGAEIAILLALVGYRVGTITQIAPAIPHGIAISPRPGIYAVIVAAAVLQTVAVTARCFRTRHYVGAGWTWFDLALSCAFLLLEFWYLPADLSSGSWVAWAPAYALMSLASAAAGIPRRSQFTVGIAGVVACFAVTSQAGAPRDLTDLFSSSLMFVIVAMVLRILIGFLRRIAGTADDARAGAVDSASRAQLDRTRLLLHDSATILRLVGQGDHGPEVEAMLRRQAATESVRLRNFLTGDHPEPAEDHPDGRRLVDVVRSAGSGFGDLLIDYAVDLAAEVVLDPATGDAVGRALGALLHNVRVHAAASSVVLHADVADGEWEITVRDDGRGFDQARTEPGFGLSIQVERALSVRGVSALVVSTPGEGTTGVLRGVWEPST